jgi:hypothetical protein
MAGPVALGAPAQLLLANDLARVQFALNGGGFLTDVAGAIDLKPAALGDGGLFFSASGRGSYAWDALELGSMFFLALLAAALRSRRQV